MTFKLREGVALAEIEYGMALLDEDSGEYWSLNPTGALILERLLAGCTTAEAVQELATQYDVDYAVASGDVDELVGVLRSAWLIDG